MTLPAPENRKRLGADGERIARAHLERLGWRILAANYRCTAGEMDLIAAEPTPQGEILAFVEVKTRRGAAHGSPVEAVDRRKQEKLAAVALAYLGERNAGGEEPACRFDVMEVLLSPNGMAKVILRRGIFGER